MVLAEFTKLCTGKRRKMKQQPLQSVKEEDDVKEEPEATVQFTWEVDAAELEEMEDWEWMDGEAEAAAEMEQFEPASHCKAELPTQKAMPVLKRQPVKQEQ